MTDVTATTAGLVRRPAAITGICVLGVIGVAGIAWLVSTGALRGAPDWYVILLAVSVIVNIAAMVGMFMMRKWGAYLYAGMFVIGQIVLFTTGLWGIQTAIVPLIVTIVALTHVGRMR
jgi:hypothetical protein